MVLDEVGSFDAPVYVTSPPGDRAACSSSSRAGRSASSRTARRSAPVPRHPRQGHAPAASRACCRSRSRPTTRAAGLFYVYYTDTGRRRARRRVPARERRRAPTPARRAGSCSARTTRAQPQRRPARCSGPTGTSTSASATAAAAATSTARAATARTSARCSARSCASTRGERRQALHDPGRQPVRRAAPARGREIYSYGLRNPWRFSFDRTTGDLTIGDVGQDAVEEIDFVRRGKGRGRELRLARRSRARSRYTPGESAPGRVKPVITTQPRRRQLLDHRRLRGPRPALPALRGRYVFGDFCRGGIQTAKLSRGQASSRADTQLEGPQLSSFGEDARGRVYATSLDGPVYRLVAVIEDSTPTSARAEPGPVHADRARTRGSSAATRRGWSTRARRSPRTSTRSPPRWRRAAARAGSRSRTTTPTTPRRLPALRERLGGVPRSARPTCARATATVRPVRRAPRPGHADDHLVFVAGAARASPATRCSARAACSSAGRLREYLDGLRRLRALDARA